MQTLNLSAIVRCVSVHLCVLSSSKDTTQVSRVLINKFKMPNDLNLHHMQYMMETEVREGEHNKEIKKGKEGGRKEKREGGKTSTSQV